MTVFVIDVVGNTIKRAVGCGCRKAGNDIPETTGGYSVSIALGLNQATVGIIVVLGYLTQRINGVLQLVSGIIDIPGTVVIRIDLTRDITITIVAVTGNAKTRRIYLTGSSTQTVKIVLCDMLIRAGHCSLGYRKRIAQAIVGIAGLQL
jgi:hypothetical protein